ncbi:hypothetical protein [Acinetobacter radioresistens]|uniref:hypothetical protein n=1 Tax=Acinetobacter radioresistens TaxID=40216 RepID=UPI0020033F20|nr:hypothetical protein [Acinetobacter radioresistens]MCK4081311.1 hypothetical protein [Acinetobacter radioresistens]
MSAKLGTLTLDLVAKIGGYIEPIKQAEKQTQTSFSKMRDHVNTYGLAIAGAASTAVVGLAAMALETANQAAELEKFAFRANSTTQEFQKMAVGAAAFGVEGDKLSDMLKDFNEKWGELTTIGAGGGVDFFEQIAMKTEGSSEAAKKLILDMQKLSGPEALQMYVNKLEEAGVTQQQMSFYLESMASDLTDLYPLLANGGEGFRLYGDMAERAGLIMTDETVESAKALKDQVYMLDLQLQGAKNQLMQAVIPAFVDISEAFLGGSEQGLQFSEVAEGVAKTLKGLASIAIGAVTAFQLVGKGLAGMAAIGGAIYSELDWYEMNPLGLVKAAYEARAQIASVTSEIKTDMHDTVIGAAERLDQMWSGGSSEQAKQLRGIRELQQNVGGVTNGLDELAAKQDKAEKATKKNNKELNDQKRLLEEQKQLRESLIYSFADNEYKLQLDYEKQIAEVRKAGFPADQEKRFLDASKNRYQTERDLLQAQMAFDISEHRLNEEEKLNFSLALQKKGIAARTDIANNLRGLYYKAAQEQHDQEIAWLRLEQAQRLQDAQSYYLTDMQNMTARYEFEREQIRLNKELLEEDKVALIGASYRSQDRENDDARYAAWGNYRDAIGIDMSAEDDRSRREEAITEALEWELITREEYQQRMLESEQNYYIAKAQLGLDSAQQTLGTWTSVFGSLLGEQSSAYAAMFALEKGFAVAKALMAAPEAYSKAYNAVVGTPYIGPYIAPVMGGAAAAAQVAQAAIIKSVNFSGQAHDGLEYVPREGTYLLDKGERVVTSNTSAKLDKTLDRVQQAQSSNPANSPNVNLNPNFVIVDEREKLGDYLYSPDGKKAFVKFFKQNRRELGLA